MGKLHEMETTEINLAIGQYLSNIEPFKSNGIPTNSITHKQLPGCGVTTLEIRFTKHNSIIILPNVPVIKDKVAKHNKDYPNEEILGVYKGIDAHDIRIYVLKDVQYKKILTTPEGFSKILKAFEHDLDTLYNDYFLLFDECERIITDVSYRGNIAAPLEYFFKFTGKALVSATTLKFSDSRFDDFSHYTIVPQYDYSQPLTIVSTNNVLSSLKSTIAKLESERICIFINSTNCILAITEALDIRTNSKAFCAEESVMNLMERHYMHASSDFKVKEMGRYNLFTSRYFSAIDMELDIKPDVIMVTDIYFAPHSIIDPHTEAIQIAGRFRNGVNSFIHITNYNPLMEVKTQQDAKSYLMGCLDTYEYIVELYNKSTQVSRRNTLNFFVKDSPLAGFYNDNVRNSFMIDNDLNEERVKEYYLNKQNLLNAYQEMSDHFRLTLVDEEYPVGDEDMYVLKRKETKVEKTRYVAHLLQRYTAKPKGIMLLLTPVVLEQKNILTRKYPLVAEAVRLVGVERLEQTGYDLDILKKVVKSANETNQIKSLARYVHEEFEENTFVPESEIIDSFTLLYAQHKVSGRLFATHILRYYNGRRTTENGVNGYKLYEKLPV